MSGQEDSEGFALDDAALAIAREFLGIPFLAYVSNSEPDRVAARLSGDAKALGEANERALSNAIELAIEWIEGPILGAPPGFSDAGPRDRMRLFGWFDPSYQMSIGNILRRNAGGEIPAPGENLDDVERPLLAAALDYFPGTLVPAPHPDHPFQGYPLIARERGEPFIAAATADEDLSRLFQPGEPVFTSAGIGYGALDAGRVATCVLASAEHRARIFGGTSLAEYVELVRDGLRIVRELARTGKAEVPTAIGIAYVEIPADVVIRGPRGGRLRAARDTDMRIPRTAPPTMVLETKCAVRLHVGSGDYQDDFWDGWKEFILDGELIALAGLLGVRREDHPVLPLPTWRKVFEPLGAFAGSMEFEHPVQVVHLTGDEARLLEDWIARVEAHYDPKLRVAVKRTLAAFSERLDGEDALVDLVIALESLFGSTEGELTLRISTALAWLLGEDAEDRHHLQRDAKRVYRARSRVVHGGELSDRESEENQRRAEELVLAALRALFERRPELIAESERATKLILNEDDGARGGASEIRPTRRD